MTKLHYLTVQDILWINLQVTKKVQHFSHAKLEEATFYQYAYGDSNEPVAQAARFLAGFSKMRPFSGGNEATAFIGTVVFMMINGYQVELSDTEAATWFETGAASPEAARTALSAKTSVDSHAHHGKPDIRAVVKDVLAAYPKTLIGLTQDAVSA